MRFENHNIRHEGEINQILGGQMKKIGRPFGTTKTGLKYLNENELKRFFSAIDKSKNKRDMFLYRIVLFLGLRISEAAQIKLSDLNLESHQISIQGIKNGRSRVYDLNGKISQKLDTYLKVRAKKADRKNVYLFPHGKRFDEPIDTQSLQNHFKVYAAQAGLNGDFSVHSLRHSCGILHAKDGESAIQIMLWLRHRSVQSTECYFEQIKFEKQDERAAEVFSEYL